MRIQTYGGITIRYRRDPVPYCGVYRLRKPIPPYNKRTEVLNSIQEEEFRPFRYPVFKEAVHRYGGCINCYRYLVHGKRHTDRCWKTNYKCRKQWMKFGKASGPIRNSEMVKYASEAEMSVVVAFRSPRTKGTNVTVKKATNGQIINCPQNRTIVPISDLDYSYNEHI